MAKSNTDQEPSTSNNQGTKSKTSQLSLPKVCLTRLDEKALKMPSKSSLKKPIKRLSTDNKKLSLSKNSPKESKIKRPRGRPKKIGSEVPVAKNIKNTVKEVETKGKKSVTSKSGIKNSVQPQKISGRISKKSLLQKKSKVVIPLAKKKNINEKKVKQIIPAKKKQTSKTVTKQAPPKPKLKVLPTKPESSDSSEDEFLYDELIEELENNIHKQVGVKTAVSEKTTNITLKPNIGNKAPIIVKGGIVKKTDLPADLKLIASPKTPNLNKDIEQSEKINNTKTIERPSKRTQDNLKSPVPSKKSSPWPITITSPQKKSGNNNQRLKLTTTKTEISLPRSENMSKEQKRSEPSVFDSNIKPVTVGSTAPKIKPKQTAKVIPISKAFEQDGNLSDEYLEEESLECDLESSEHQIKANQKGKKEIKPVSSVNGSLDKDDPNIDLLRILTDDPDEPVPLETNLQKEINVDPEKTIECNPEKLPDEKSILEIKTVSKEKPVAEIKAASEENQSKELPTEEMANQIEEESPERTIYDLMNEVSLQYPSWNLHIIPETTAFCIAQITKGRLGLPTLKKCIELDPVNYSAKVFIHQYHIKRFDGVYDSEESILALIQEINNIKA